MTKSIVTWEEGEIGRFLNEYGEGFIIYEDDTFASDETDWERLPFTSSEDDEEVFVFSDSEAETIGSIVLTHDPEKMLILPVFLPSFSGD